MKKIICLILLLCIIFAFSGCIRTKLLHCDSCGREITVNEGSDMNDDWIIYCNECNEELFSDDPILGNG